MHSLKSFDKHFTVSNHLKNMVYIRFTLCVYVLMFEQRSNDRCIPLEYHTDYSHCPKHPLCSIHPSTPSLEAINSGRAPEKWWFWQINFREWKDQRTMKRGGCPGHGPSQQSRQEMVNSIGLACLFHKDILNCALFSLQSLSFPLLFYIARILT